MKDQDPASLKRRIRELEQAEVEWKKERDELKKSEALFRSYFDLPLHGIAVTSPEKNWIRVNDRICSILGYSREEIVRMTWAEMTHPDDLAADLVQFDRVLSGQIDHYQMEKRFIRKGGAIVWTNLSVGCVRKPDGRVDYTVALVEDITSFKLAEEAIRDSEKKYHELYDFLPIPVYEMDLESNITSANRAIYECFGGTEANMKNGVKAWQLLSPEEVEKSKANIQRLLKGENIGGTEYLLRRLDGSVFPAIIVSSIIHKNGRPAGLRGAIIDITQRKQAEENLRRMNAFLDSIVENIPDMIFIKDAKELRFARINRAGEDLLGYTKEDLLGKNDYDLFPKDQADFFTGKDREVLGRKEVMDIPEESLQTRLKGIRTIHTKKVPILNPEGELEYLLGISEDITDRKRAAQALAESEEKFRKAFYTSPDSVNINRLEDGLYVSINPGFTRLSGYTEEDTLEKTSLEINIWGRAEDRKKLIAGLKKDGVVINLEASFRTKFGELRTGLMSATMIDLNGVPHILSITRDISDRKRAEQALKESENKYRLLAENVNDVIFVLDMSLNYTYISPSVKILRGYEPAEVLKQPSSETLTPSSWDLAMRTLSEVLELEKSGGQDAPVFRILPLEMVRKDGTAVWTEVKFSIIRDDRQRPTAILGVTRDITERRRVEEKLQKTLQSLRTSVGATIQVMVSAVEIRDPYTAGHQLRSADLARTIAVEMGLPQDRIDGIRMAGSIHDIGKLSVPAEILSKPSKLTEMEFSLIKEHSQKGYEMLRDVESQWPLAEIIYQHHERMDGSGYPRRLKGDEILLEARILAVSDVVESMASHRPYRPALGVEAALAEIEKYKGLLYDPAVAEACLKLFREKGYELP